jgi:hypothetical protein
MNRTPSPQDNPDDKPFVPWLDPSAIPPDDLSAEDRRRFGDHLWMESLLREVHRPIGASDREVEEHLARWEQATSPASIPSHATTHARARTTAGPAIPPAADSVARHWLFSTMTISAALASVFILWSFSSGSTPTAQAAFAQAKQRAVEPVDRKYLIEFTLASLPLVHAELFLRGPDRLALKVEGPAENSVWIGTTRERSWLVPSIGPVLVANDFQPVLDHFSRMLRLPSMSLRIADVLSMIEKDYAMELANDEMIPAFGDTPARQVVARKREGFRPLLPMKVTFWTHPDTGVVGRLVLEWAGQLETIAVRKVCFELAEEKHLPDRWYDHSIHHADQSRVLVLDVPPRKEQDPAATPSDGTQGNIESTQPSTK